MKGSQPFGLVNEGSLFNFSQHFPLRSKSFGYFWIVHLWVFLGHFASLASGPNHESIHGPFDMFCWSRGCWRVVLLLASTVVYWRWTHLWIKLRLEQFNPKRIEILVSAKLNNLWSSNSSTCPRLSQFGPNQMNGKLWLWMLPNQAKKCLQIGFLNVWFCSNLVKVCLSTDRETALYPAALAANARRPIIHPRKIQINLLLFFAPPTKSQSCGRRGNACQKTADTSPSNSMIIENKKWMYTYLFWKHVLCISTMWLANSLEISFIVSMEQNTIQKSNMPESTFKHI